MKRLKKILGVTFMVIGICAVAEIFVMAILVTFFPNTDLSIRIQNAMSAAWPQQEEVLAENIYDAFRSTLQEGVRERIGMPIEGYVPSMFLSAFPGLSETDFEGVEASIGHYTVEKGRLVHQTDDSRLIHSAAGAITDRGMDRLLKNVSSRLKINLEADGTLTKIMSALVHKEISLPSPSLEEPVACTMDAKICPDGTAVGRVGPSCEFAPCPGV
jgi:hypothetical protein